MREKNEEKNELIVSQCFICGIKRKRFDLEGKGWLEHIYIDHNVYNYLAFNIYLRNKNYNSCNTVEAHIKKLISDKSI